MVRKALQLFTFRKLATRFSAVTLFIMITIVAAMSIALFLPNSTLFHNQIDQELALTTENIATSFDHNLQAELTKLESIASYAQLLGPDKARHLELVKAFASQHKEFGQGVSISMDLEGKNAVLSTGLSIDLSGRTYIPQLRRGESAIAPPARSKADPSTLIVPFAAPLMKDGITYGFYSSAIEINEATRVIRDTKVGDTGYAILLDMNGTFVYYPDSSYIMKKNIADLGVPEITAAFESAKQGKPTAYSYEFGGVKKIGFAYGTETGFVTMLAVPESELMAPINKMMRTTLITALVVALAALIAIYAFTTRMVKPIIYITAMVKKLSTGDFRPRIEIRSKDELGELAAHMNGMLDGLSSMIEQVSKASVGVASSAEQITISTDEVAKGSVDQAAQAGVMSELFGSLDNSIRSVSTSAREAKSLSGETVNIAKEGTNLINQTIGQMDEVNRHMAQLESDSRKIGDISGVINDIAEQTNLLALNAAIEAARAGEQGRGFAVVADEVRKLAERSGDATRQIAGIIKVMQNSAEKSVLAVGESVAQFAKTRDSFSDIVMNVQMTSSKVEEIFKDSQGQAAASGEVMQSISSVAAISEQSAAAAEETAASSQELSYMAAKLNESVEKFKY
ncbi:methyl-accepting chemotaxis protein [Paenibacillus lignilyticus]|uniref:Methyl-accepting chemotaxis protein n=1 Tax=Paenibacillus lignilyticus TaxID=1172615 RepID=A0ABS5CCZ4_9BACL|nr:methyl-accepting chemotaxis protein [Paenibacillus lignilyticus]MBP3961532.1 methyl-accepting chemotaxis protein [Paenibacillus lignilyticus]MBP3963798.1 methyl-accepting chemotaxis protein [Paenibacillus lignilyticus]